MGSNSAAWYTNHGCSKDEDSNLDSNADGGSLNVPHDACNDENNDGLAFHVDDEIGDCVDDAFDGHDTFGCQDHDSFDNIGHDGGGDEGNVQNIVLIRPCCPTSVVDFFAYLRLGNDNDANGSV